MNNLTKILFGQLNCSVKFADVWMTTASSRNVGKFYRTVKLSEKNLRLFMQSNSERCHFRYNNIMQTRFIGIITSTIHPYTVRML